MSRPPSRDLDALPATVVGKTRGPGSGAGACVGWKNARVVMPGAGKLQLTLRLDAKVRDWFKAQGKGYQTRINAVLRSYVEAHREG